MLTGREVCEVTEGLPDDHITVFRDALLELLLQIPATMLVLAKAGDLAGQVLETSTREAVDYGQRNHSVNRSD